LYREHQLNNVLDESHKPTEAGLKFKLQSLAEDLKTDGGESTNKTTRTAQSEAGNWKDIETKYYIKRASIRISNQTRQGHIYPHPYIRRSGDAMAKPSGIGAEEEVRPTGLSMARRMMGE
jgi:hypothetical protein